MTLTKEQQAELLKVASPLIKWLCDNCHPHCTALVDNTTVELVEGVAAMHTNEFLKD